MNKGASGPGLLMEPAHVGLWAMLWGSWSLLFTSTSALMSPRHGCRPGADKDEDSEVVPLTHRGSHLDLEIPPRLQKPPRPLAAPFPMEAWGRRRCHCCDFTHRSQLSATVCDGRGLNVPLSLAELGVAMRPRTLLRAFLKGSQPCALELGPQHSTQSSLNSTGSHGRQRILDGPTGQCSPQLGGSCRCLQPTQGGRWGQALS